MWQISLKDFSGKKQKFRKTTKKPKRTITSVKERSIPILSTGLGLSNKSERTVFFRLVVKAPTLGISEIEIFPQL